jgi:putative ABC transport system permease protein
VGPLIETKYISNPSINFSVAITTVFILIIAGAVAGFFPAWKAARIKPIDALRNE